MLGERFHQDNKSVLPLTKNQSNILKSIEKKIEEKHYVFSKMNCIVCNLGDFEKLSEKDRTGLPCSVVICKNCGLIQTNPRLSESNYLEFYKNEYRPFYHSREKPTEEFFENQQKHGKLIYEFLSNALKKEIKGKFVVEIGAGAGGNLQYFKEKNNQVFGLDLDSNYITFGKEKGLDLVIGTVEDLSKVKKPDIIIYSHVLEHISDPINELNTIKKFLHKDSLLYVEVPGVKHLHLSYKQDFLRYLQFPHLYHFTLNSLYNCLKKCGFELIAGNEIIQALFRIGNIQKSHSNEYESNMVFLKNLEKIRTNPLNVHRFRYKIFATITYFLGLTKTKHIAQSIYNKYKQLILKQIIL